MYRLSASLEKPYLPRLAPFSPSLVASRAWPCLLRTGINISYQAESGGCHFTCSVCSSHFDCGCSRSGVLYFDARRSVNVAVSLSWKADS
jgi:hypothetical protein